MEGGRQRRDHGETQRGEHRRRDEVKEIQGNIEHDDEHEHLCEHVNDNEY
jgi:hypothetical protein